LIKFVGVEYRLSRQEGDRHGHVNIPDCPDSDSTRSNRQKMFDGSIILGLREVAVGFLVLNVELHGADRPERWSGDVASSRRQDFGAV
jgi:hypothetical protein